MEGAHPMMLFAGAALLLFQQTSVQIGAGSSGSTLVIRSEAAAGRPDSARADSARRGRDRVEITPELRASAFRDAEASGLLDRAREARVRQDSSIRSYQANTVQRLSAGLSISRFGRDRLLFRYESAADVRWDRDLGATISITGRRSVAPSIADSSDVQIDGALSPVPYFPGRDALWVGSTVVREDRVTSQLIHPLTADGEAFYRYASGDSATVRLQDGTVIRLRELEVMPRRAGSNVVVGTLWFDVSTGQLVRAAYRLSEPHVLLDDPEDSFLARMAFQPAEATLDAVAVEYGLHEGRFWLPRSQLREGHVRGGFVRMPLRIEERFTYSSVNGDFGSFERPEVPVRQALDNTALEGLVGADRIARRRQLIAERDSAARVLREEQCAAGGALQRTSRYRGALDVVVAIPCDAAALAASPDLPASIFDPGEEFFGDEERDALLAKVAWMMPPGLAGPAHPTVRFGFDLIRFNRVEGLSAGLAIEQKLPYAITVSAIPRFGVADRVFNGEFFIRAERPVGQVGFGGYRRLAASNDWGNPFSFGSSLSALLFGRDEGMYYRSTGAELSLDRVGTMGFAGRLFLERHEEAVTRTDQSLAKLLGAGGFDPHLNIVADRATQIGAAARLSRTFGFDPHGFRTIADLRIEGATGDFGYVRPALDLNFTQGIWRSLGAAVTLGAGSSAGAVPVQREYYIGGTGSVRGQPAGAMSGTAYWLARAELGYGLAARRVIFADLGWAGDRNAMSRVGRPASGAGVGISLLDGIVRLDVARGIYPQKGIRAMLYLDAKF